MEGGDGRKMQRPRKTPEGEGRKGRRERMKKFMRRKFFDTTKRERIELPNNMSDEGADGRRNGEV